ncbi:MAG: hypothetical protein ABI674_08325 [Spartobacteria bacterium]
MILYSKTKSPLSPGRQSAGMALVEIVVALGLLTLIVVSSTQAMMQANRQSAIMRTMTAARGIVQRNIDTALTVDWNFNTEPTILTLTPALGTPFDDDAPPASNADGVVQIAVMEDGTTTTVPGILWRIVASVPNAEGANIRKVTFRLDYNYLARPYSVQMVTERAIDD